jgi:uncharacterized membrane protein
MTMGKEWLEALSEGVLAIINHIMVLEMKVPNGIVGPTSTFCSGFY